MPGPSAAGSSGTCVDDGAYQDAAREQAKAIRTQYMVDILVETTIALWNRKSSASISGLQQDLADQNVKLAEEALAHAQQFWPYEQDLVNDVFSIQKRKPSYEGTSAAWGGIMDTDMDNARDDYNQLMAEMCMTTGRCMDARWLRNAGLQSADVRNFALRQEENRAQALNDLRYNWQYAALGMGQGKMGEIASFQEVAGSVGMNMAQLINGIVGPIASTVGNIMTPPILPEITREDLYALGKDLGIPVYTKQRETFTTNTPIEAKG